MIVLNLFGSIRTKLGNPPHSLVGDDLLFSWLYTALSYYTLELALENQNWLTGETEIDVVPGQNEYDVVPGQGGAIGKPIKIEFFDPSVPATNGPKVEIINFQDTDKILSSCSDYQNSEGFSTTSRIAKAMAFFGDPLKVRVVPTPTIAASYRLFHDKMTINIPKANDKIPFTENFIPMIELYIVGNCLPACNYPPDKYANMAAVIDKSLIKYEHNFGIHKRSRKHTQTGIPRSFSTRYYKGNRAITS